MDIIVSRNQQNLNSTIEDILIEELISSFSLISDSQNYWDCEFFEVYNYKNYMKEDIIYNIFSEEDNNIFENNNKCYVMDYKLFLHMCKCVKQDFDNFDNGEVFADLFDMDAATEQTIINNYALAYIKEQVVCDNLEHTIIKIYKNIFKNKVNKYKHSGLISLYDKYITHLNNINKKKTVIKLLNTTTLSPDLCELISGLSI